METGLPRIYQIGFNKCGTLSLHHFFQINGLTSVHWDEGRLARSIYQNWQDNLPLFSGYEGVQCFSDMEYRDSTGCSHYAYADLYEKMHAQDSEGLFILNFRPLDEWIYSRTRHYNASGCSYLSREVAYFRKSEDEIFKIWADHYHKHLELARAYFQNSPNFLSFDISEHNGSHLTSFLRSHGFEITREDFANVHKTDTKLQAEHPFLAPAQGPGLPEAEI